jgi:hypothetical protein
MQRRRRWLGEFILRIRFNSAPRVSLPEKLFYRSAAHYAVSKHDWTQA